MLLCASWPPLRCHAQAAHQICARLEAQQITLPPESPETPSDPPDTERLQEALDTCPAGQTLELTRSTDHARTAFYTEPLQIPAGVTLQLDSGVTLYPTSATAAPMIEAAADATLAGPGVIDASTPRSSLPEASRPDLIRSTGSLTLFGLTLRNAPGISVHQTTSAPLTLTEVSIVSRAQPLAFDDPTTPLTLSSVALSGSAPLILPPSLNLSDVSLYAAAGPNHCIVLPSACLPTDLPPILGRLLLSPGNILTAILTPAEAGTPTPTGEILFFDNDSPIGTAEITDGLAELPLPPLTPGSHSVTAATSDGTLHFGAVHLHIARPKLQTHTSTTLSTSAAHFPFGSNVVLTVSITPSTATGTVTLTDGTQPLALLSLAGGAAVFTSNTFAPGTHAVTASYSGDTTNAPSQSPPLTLVIEPDTTNLQLSPLPAISQYGASPPLTVTLSPPSAIGVIHLHDLASTPLATTLASAPILSGIAIFPLATLTVGSHTLSATYSGDTNDQPSASFATTTVITAIPSILTFTALPTTASFGTPLALNAQLTPPDATGTLTFQDSIAGQLAQLPAAATSATSTSTLSAGVHSLTVLYSGDGTHSPAISPTRIITIQQASTSTTLTALPSTLSAATPITLAASVTPASAGGSVVFRDTASGTLGQTLITSGIATLKLTNLTPGTHTFIAIFSGDANDAPSTSTPITIAITPNATLLLLGPLPANLPFGSPLKLTANTQPPSISGLIVFSDDANAIASALLNNGTASITVSSLSTGTHTLSANFAGDPNDAPAASAPQLVTITPAVSSAILTLAQNPIPAGTPIVVNVRVSSAFATPTGTVTLRCGSTTLASGPLVNLSPGSSYVTLSIPSTSFPAGTYPVSASYSGDTNVLPSASASSDFTLVPTPVLGTLSVSKSSIPAGTSVTLTVTLTSSSPPTGSVTFFANNIAIGTSQLDSSGKTSVTLPPLAVGSWVLSATYAPVSPFTSTQITPLVLTVQQPFTVDLSPADLTLTASQSGSSTLTLTPLSGFAGTVDLTCAPADSFIQCAFGSSTLYLTNSTPASIPVNVALGANVLSRTVPLRSALPLSILAILLPILPLRRTRILPLLRIAFLLCIATLLSSCGAGYFNVIPRGSYQVNITASVSGNSTSRLLTVTVPPAP